MDVVVQRFDVWLVTLDPTVGSTIRKAGLNQIASPSVFSPDIQIAPS